MAEVHIIGQIESAHDFPSPRLFVVWQLQYGGGWRVLNGCVEGQSQCDNPRMDNVAYFCHPIDLHMATRTMQGWPRIQLQVWHQDEYGRQELCAYGIVHVPTTPGEHLIDTPTWRVQISMETIDAKESVFRIRQQMGTFREEVLQRFVGGGVQLRSIDAVINSPVEVRTVAQGNIRLRLGLIMRNFDKFGIEC